MQISKEFKVGSLAITAIVVLYLGVEFLKGSSVFSRSNKYFVYFDRIDGLTASNPVTLNGLTVGLVRRTTYFQKRKHPILVEIEVDKGIELSDSSRIILANNGLLSGKMMVLDPRAGNKLLQHKDTLMGYEEEGMMQMMQNKALPMLENLNSLMATLDNLLASFSKTGDKLNTTLEGVSELTKASVQLVGKNEMALTKTTGNLADLTGSLVETEKKVKLLLDKMNRLGDTLNKARIAALVQKLNSTTENMNKLLDNVNKGNGTMGKLAKDDSLYRNLNHSAASLNLLLSDLKANPKRYVHFSLFGGDKKEKKKK